MAAIVHFSKQDATQRLGAAGGTTAAEVTEYTVSWADLTGAGFANGDDVIVFIKATLNVNNATNQPLSTWGRGSTFAGRTILQTDEIESGSANATLGAREICFLDRLTLATDNNFYTSIQVDTTATPSLDDYCFFIMKLDDLAADDFRYADTTPTGNAPDTVTDGASVTLPASGGDDWLVLGNVYWLTDNASDKMISQLSLGGNVRMINSTEGEDPDERVGRPLIGYLAAAANSAVCLTQYYNVNGHASPNDVTRTAIFALRMEAFANHVGNMDQDEIAMGGVLDTYVATNTVSLALSATGPVAWFAQTIADVGATFQGPYHRVQLDGTDIVAGLGRASSWNYDVSDQLPLTQFGTISMSSGTRVIDVDCANELKTNAFNFDEHTLVAFSMELAAPVNVRVSHVALQALVTNDNPPVRVSHAALQVLALIPVESTPVDADFAIPVEWLAGLEASAESPIEWIGAITADSEIPVEWLGALEVEYATPIEWTAELAAEFTIPIEWTQGIESAHAIPIEWTAEVAQSFAVPAEWLAGISQSFAIPVEWLAGVESDHAVPIEWLAGVESDQVILIDWTGAIAVSADYAVPIEWTAQIAVDNSQPIEWTAELNREFAVPIEWTQGVESTHQIPIEYLAGVEADFAIPIEWTNALAQSYLIAFDHVAGIESDHEIPVEWVAGIEADHVIPSEWTAELSQSFAILAEWVASVGSDHVIPIEWTLLEDNAVSASYPIPIEWTGALAAAFEIPAEWLTALESEHEIPVESLTGVESDHTPAIEWTTELASLHTAPIEWFGAIAQPVTVPVEWVAGLEAELTVPTEWLTGIEASSVIPIDYGATSGLEKQFAVPIEWTGALETTHEIPIEYLSRVSSDAEIPFEYLASLSGDAVPLIDWVSGVASGQVILIDWWLDGFVAFIELEQCFEWMADAASVTWEGASVPQTSWLADSDCGQEWKADSSVTTWVTDPPC